MHFTASILSCFQKTAMQICPVDMPSCAVSSKSGQLVRECYQYGEPYCCCAGSFNGHSTRIWPSFQRIIRKSTGSTQYFSIYLSTPSLRRIREEFGDIWMPIEVLIHHEEKSRDRGTEVKGAYQLQCNGLREHSRQWLLHVQL
jgi:hypothetical protein